MLTREARAATDMPRLPAVSSTKKALTTSKELHTANLGRISLLRVKPTEATVKAQIRYNWNFGEKVPQISVYDKDCFIYLQDDSLCRDDNPSHKLKPKIPVRFTLLPIRQKPAWLRETESPTLSVLTERRLPGIKTKAAALSYQTHKTNTSCT